MKNTRTVGLIVLLVVVAFGAWWYLNHRSAGQTGGQITMYYTKMDGKTEAGWPVSMLVQPSGETAAQQLHDTVQYAAVQAVAGPPPNIEAVRFPAGTRVNSVSVAGSTATVDLSRDVENQPGGTFGENAEFKSLVYTLTALPGIDAVQVTVAGHTLATLPGGNLELDQPLRRSDW